MDQFFFCTPRPLRSYGGLRETFIHSCSIGRHGFVGGKTQSELTDTSPAHRPTVLAQRMCLHMRHHDRLSVSEKEPHMHQVQLAGEAFNSSGLYNRYNGGSESMVPTSLSFVLS